MAKRVWLGPGWWLPRRSHFGLEQRRHRAVMQSRAELRVYDAPRTAGQAEAESPAHSPWPRTMEEPSLPPPLLPPPFIGGVAPQLVLGAAAPGGGTTWRAAQLRAASRSVHGRSGALAPAQSPGSYRGGKEGGRGGGQPFAWRARRWLRPPWPLRTSGVEWCGGGRRTPRGGPWRRRRVEPVECRQDAPWAHKGGGIGGGGPRGGGVGPTTTTDGSLYVTECSFPAAPRPPPAPRRVG